MKLCDICKKELSDSTIPRMFNLDWGSLCANKIYDKTTELKAEYRELAKIEKIDLWEIS